MRFWLLEGLRKTRKKTHPCGLGTGRPWPLTVLCKLYKTQTLEKVKADGSKVRYISFGQCAVSRVSFRDRLRPGMAEAEPTWMCP